MERQKVFDFALKIFLFLSPIFVFRNFQVSLAQGIFFIIGSFILFGIGLALEPKRRFANIWISLFTLWALLRVISDLPAKLDPAQAWFNFWLGSAAFIYILAGILLFYTVYSHADEPQNYFTPILIVCIMNLILAVAQQFRHDFMWFQAPSLCGFMAISSQLGQYSALSIPILGYINPFLAIIPVITLFMANSISPIVATFVGLIILCIFSKKKWLILPIISTIIILAFFNFNYIIAKWHARPVMWERTLTATMKKPFLGWGYRTFTQVVVDPQAITAVGAQEFSRPHNDFLHTGQEMGIPAVIFIIGFLVHLFRKFKEREDNDLLTYILATSVLIVLINGCGQTEIRYANIAGTFIVLLSFLMIKIDTP